MFDLYNKRVNPLMSAMCLSSMNQCVLCDSLPGGFSLFFIADVAVMMADGVSGVGVCSSAGASVVTTRFEFHRTFLGTQRCWWNDSRVFFFFFFFRDIWGGGGGVGGG